MAQVAKIDSNATALAFAEETSIGVLPGTPDWYELEPNSYSDFGGQITNTPRNPINADRQRRKGVTTDLDASGSFEQDITTRNFERLAQGYLFADLENKTEFGGGGEITGVVTATDDYQAASGLDDFAAGDIVFASGFSDSTNNGLKTVSSATGTALTVDQNLADETPPNAAKLVQVGFEFAGGDAEIDASGSLPALTTTSKDLTELGLIPGEWVYIGGDAATEGFETAANNGWKRVRSVSANSMTFDKSVLTMITETDGDSSQSVRIFIGRRLRNRLSGNIVRRTYQIERKLGVPDTSSPSEVQSEYLVGSVPSELTMTFNEADKLMGTFAFVCNDHETRTGATGVKSGNRITPSDDDAFNTTSDVVRMGLTPVETGVESPEALFTYATEITISVNNNVTPNKAISVLGAFDQTAGTFQVSASMTAYFNNVSAIAAVRNNQDVTVDAILVRENRAMTVDMPLVAVGDGRLTVEQDQPIRIPLSPEASSGRKIDVNLDHTLMMGFFDYVPDEAS